uniref:C2H2-type domain-containing protein n=1 Tax=Strongyloides papillosus TaxID=174720 RepID=A0A0N5BAZ3_STREA
MFSFFTLIYDSTASIDYERSIFSPTTEQEARVPKPLGCANFTIVDLNINANDNSQCIWCGMFMKAEGLAIHFGQYHPSEYDVPQIFLCSLDLVVINAKLTEKFDHNF